MFLAAAACAARSPIYWEFPKGTTLAEANDEAQWYERWLTERKDKYKFKNLSSRIGRSSGRFNLSFASGMPKTQAKDVIKQLRKELPKRPGIDPEIYSRLASGDEASEGDRGFYVRLTGRDSEALREWASDLKDRLLAEGLAASVDLGRVGKQEELRVNVSRTRMQELGVDPNMVFGTVTAGLRGQQVSRIKRPGGRELRLIAEYDDSAAMELKDLKEMQVWSRQSGFQRLGNLADFEFAKGYSSIYRRNGVLTANVAGERPEGVEMSHFTAGLTRVMRSMPIPRGYKWKIGGDSRRNNEDMGALLAAFAMALVLVVLVMGVLFESVVLPIAAGATLVVAIPFGLTGLLIFGKLFDGTAVIGLMILAGVVVNNGIVLLDHIVRLRKELGDRREAILQGARDRIRPILMTATTTIVGLLPMMFTSVDSGRGISYSGMATVVATGLFFGTFLTPVIVPLSYTILDDLRGFTRRSFALARQRVARPAAKTAKAA